MSGKGSFSNSQGDRKPKHMHTPPAVTPELIPCWTNQKPYSVLACLIHAYKHVFRNVCWYLVVFKMS